MGELRVDAAVRGTDGDLGRIDALIVDPVTREISHLVLEHSAVEPRRMVPVDLVTAADPDEVVLGVDDAALHQLPRFDEPAYNVPDEEFAADDLILDPGSYFLEPFATPLDGFVLADHERIPKGEVAVRRGTEVLSSDGTTRRPRRRVPDRPGRRPDHPPRAPPGSPAAPRRRRRHPRAGRHPVRGRPGGARPRPSRGGAAGEDPGQAPRPRPPGRRGRRRPTRRPLIPISAWRAAGAARRPAATRPGPRAPRR